MVEPATGALGVAKASDQALAVTGNLLQRVLGPSADEIGIALARFTAFRVGNVTKIVEGAERKGRNRRGSVPPRVVHRVLEDGSYSDDSVIVEYLSGVLAASRAEGGRDDRGVSWSTLIAGMSSIQIRAHYLFYREWASRLHGRTDVNLAMEGDRGDAQMSGDLYELVACLSHDNAIPDGPRWPYLSHAIAGLERLGLLSGDYRLGPDVDHEFDRAFSVGITIQGIELYYWAMGAPDLRLEDWTTDAEAFELDPPLPRLTSSVMRRLERRDRSDDAAPAASATTGDTSEAAVATGGAEIGTSPDSV